MQIDTRLWKKKKKPVTQRIVNSSRPLPLPPSNPSPEHNIPTALFPRAPHSFYSFPPPPHNLVDATPSLFPTKRWNRYANNTGGHREIRFGGDARAILRLSIASPSSPLRTSARRKEKGERIGQIHRCAWQIDYWPDRGICLNVITPVWPRLPFRISISGSPISI